MFPLKIDPHCYESNPFLLFVLANPGFICSSQLSGLLYKLFLFNKAQIQPNLQLNQHERALRQSCSHLLFTLVLEATCIIRWLACVLDIASSGPIHRGYVICYIPLLKTLLFGSDWQFMFSVRSDQKFSPRV